MKIFSGRNYIIPTIIFLVVSYILIMNSSCVSITEKLDESMYPSTITISEYQNRNATIQLTLSPTTNSSTKIITPVLSPTKIPTSSLRINESWENHGPYGGIISTLVIDPIHPNIMYVGIGSKNGGLWKSIDSGTNWKRSDEGILSPSISFYYGITTLVIDPKTPSTLYVGIDQSGIFKSIDSGDHWEPIHNEVTETRIKAMAVDPETSGTVYVGTLSGIRKTVDGGNTWENVLESDNSISDFISYIYVDPSETSTVYAGTSSIQGGEKSGVYKSIDSGNSWTFSDIGLDNTDISAIVIDPVRPKTLYAATIQLCGCGGGISDDEGGVYRSLDGGVSWSRMINGLVDVRASSLAVDPLNPSTLYAGTYGGAFISTNGGEYWKEMPLDKSHPSVQVLAINPIDPSNIIIGALGGIYKSTDNGMTWSEGNHGLSGTNTLVLAANPKRPERLLASVLGKGLYESSDNGKEWNKLFSGSIPLRFINSLAMDWSNPEILYAGSDYIGIYKSIDGGVSWRDLKSGFSDLDPLYRENAYNSVNTIVIDPVEPTTIYAGTGYGLYISKNGGETWISSGLFDAWTIAIDPINPKNIFAGNSKGLYKKRIDSQGWDQLTIGPDCNYIISIVIDPLNPNIIFASNRESIFKSLDGGRNWTTRLSGQYIYSLALDNLATDEIYVSTINGILQSSDGGFTWVNIGLPEVDAFSLIITRTAPSILHAGTTNGVYSIRLD